MVAIFPILKHIFFSNIQRITPYFQMEEPDDEKAEVDAFKNSAPFWNIQKQNNILLMLDIIQVSSMICSC